MARESVRRPRQSSSIGFGSFNGDRDKGDERMSVDGDREREGSVLVSVSERLQDRADDP
jgi:hypothetical protein